MPDRPRPPPNRRRDKPQLSCNLCRRRKLKCDRKLPCQTCARRGLSRSCTYATVMPSTSVHQPMQNAVTTFRASISVHDRVAQLEDLVTTLMNAQPSTKNQPNTATETVASDASSPVNIGHLSLENNETRYVAGDHWLSIIDGIAELKHDLRDGISSMDVSTNSILRRTDQRPNLFLCHRCLPSRGLVMEDLPARPIADKLISNFFETADMASCVIHGPTFSKQYNSFWLDPSSASIMWIGLLFAMMLLGMHLPRQVALSSLDLQPETTRVYCEHVIDCLLLGEYTKCPPHTVETLIMYYSVELLLSIDSKSSNWLLVSTIVRIALKAGFHRDPCHLPQVTPFQAEIRRRHWVAISTIDLTSSVQVGLPRTINMDVCDVAEPRNLLDFDFHEGTEELPQSRSDAELTPMLFVIARNRLLHVYGAISDFNARSCTPSYADVMRLDDMLCNARVEIPVGLQLNSKLANVDDSPDVAFRRISLDLSYNKACCVLHRRYLTKARADSHFSYSRSSCLKAAQQIVEHQIRIRRELEAGGNLHKVKWKMTSSFTHSFLLGVAVLCLDANQDLESMATDPALGEAGTASDSVMQTLSLLRKSHEIWLLSVNISNEAQMACKFIETLFTKAMKYMATLPALERVEQDSARTRDKMEQGSNTDSVISATSDRDPAWNYYSLDSSNALFRTLDDYSTEFWQFDLDINWKDVNGQI